MVAITIYKDTVTLEYEEADDNLIIVKVPEECIRRYVTEICHADYDEWIKTFVGRRVDDMVQTKTCINVYSDMNASSIMHYILSNYADEKDFHIMSGKFNGYGHEWVVVNGEIVDATVDQFGDDYSIYSPTLYKELYQEEAEDFAPIIFDDWMDYIDNLFEDKARMNLIIEE